MPDLRAASATTLLAVLIGLSGCTTAVPGPQSAARKLEALFADLHERGLFDGAVVVGERETVVFEKGFGYADAEAGLAFTPDTPSDGASLAKTFTAALLLQLQSEGLLSLEDPAQRLLPELPYAEITLRHLLSHSGGLPDYGYFDRYLAADAIRTTETLLGVLSSERPPLPFPPGSAFEYSSLGYDFAALAASRVANRSFDELLRGRLFSPLGMTSAFLRPARLADFPAVRARGYRRTGSSLEANDAFDFEAFHGGSNIYVSARDLHRWNASFMGRSVLDEQTLAAVLRPAQIGRAFSGLTLGSWYRDADGPAYWYSGHLQGFHNEVFRDLSSRRSIVYVSNNTLAPWLQHAIVRAVNGILDGGEPQLLHPPPTVEIAKEHYRSLSGTWAAEGGPALTIEEADGRISVTLEGVRYAAFQVDSRSFYVPGLDFVLGFGGENSIQRMLVSTHRTERWLGRRDGLE